MSIFPRRLNHLPNPIIRLDGHRLKFVEEFPYLGQIITKKLSDSSDMEHRRRKLCALGNMITRRFAFCNLDTKLALFRSFFYSVYGCTLWCNFTQENLRRLRVVHNDILRRLTKTPRFHSATDMFGDYNVRNLTEIMNHAVINVQCRIKNSSNSLIVDILASEARVRSTIWQKWEVMLQVT